MNEIGRNGRLEVITGSMFAGKTEELIRRIRRLKYAKKNFVVFKPAIDDRYSKEEVVSHNGDSVKAFVIQDPFEIYDYIDEHVDAVAVDEVQFFPSTIVPVLDDLADRNIRVIAAGLDCDFRGEPFGCMPQLLTRAEQVTKLSAICTSCGAPATRTQRLVNQQPASYNDPIVLVGAKESYEPRCRHCHIIPDKPEVSK